MDTQTFTILVVDDSEFNREMLSRRLKRQGYNIETAADGPIALQMLTDHSIDLILLDIMMPGMSGMDVLKRVRETKTLLELPIIMVTAKTETEDVIQALEWGANDYVNKPVNFPTVLARVQTQLELRRLSSFREEFMNIASHDLKKPLALIIEVTEQLQEDIVDGKIGLEDVKNDLWLIEKSGQSIQKLVEEFLDLQTVADGRLQLDKAPCDINQLIEKLICHHEHHAENKQIAIKLSLTTTLPEIITDEKRVTQVLQNFIDNALKFSAAGTTIFINTSVEGSNFRVKVIDQGPGLTDDDLKKMFTKYAKLSNSPTGNESTTGLGLSICKQMVGLLGGEIGVENNADRGATFWFQLPIQTDK